MSDFDLDPDPPDRPGVFGLSGRVTAELPTGTLVLGEASPGLTSVVKSVRNFGYECSVFLPSNER